MINIGVGGEFPDFSPCEFITNNGANKIDTMFTSNNFTGVLQSHSILDFWKEPSWKHKDSSCLSSSDFSKLHEFLNIKVEDYAILVTDDYRSNLIDSTGVSDRRATSEIIVRSIASTALNETYPVAIIDIFTYMKNHNVTFSNINDTKLLAVELVLKRLVGYPLWGKDEVDVINFLNEHHLPLYILDKNLSDEEFIARFILDFDGSIKRSNSDIEFLIPQFIDNFLRAVPVISDDFSINKLKCEVNHKFLEDELTFRKMSRNEPLHLGSAPLIDQTFEYQYKKYLQIADDCDCFEYVLNKISPKFCFESPSFFYSATIGKKDMANYTFISDKVTSEVHLYNYWHRAGVHRDADVDTFEFGNHWREQRRLHSYDQYYTPANEEVKQANEFRIQLFNKGYKESKDLFNYHVSKSQELFSKELKISKSLAESNPILLKGSKLLTEIDVLKYHVNLNNNDFNILRQMKLVISKDIDEVLSERNAAAFSRNFEEELYQTFKLEALYGEQKLINDQIFYFKSLLGDSQCLLNKAYGELFDFLKEAHISHVTRDQLEERLKFLKSNWSSARVGKENVLKEEILKNCSHGDSLDFLKRLKRQEPIPFYNIPQTSYSPFDIGRSQLSILPKPKY